MNDELKSSSARNARDLLREMVKVADPVPEPRPAKQEVEVPAFVPELPNLEILVPPAILPVVITLVRQGRDPVYFYRKDVVMDSAREIFADGKNQGRAEGELAERTRWQYTCGFWGTAGVFVGLLIAALIHWAAR